MAMGSRDVPASALDGVAESDQHAAELAFRVNVERQKARFKAAARGGLKGILEGVR